MQLDRPVTDLSDAERKLAARVLPAFGITPEPLQTDPRDYEREADDQRGEQTVTLLQSLGYLAEPAAGPGTWYLPAGDLESAWNTWSAEWADSTAAAEPGLTIDLGEEEVVRTAATTAEDRARRHLKACATLEGEAMLARWPEVGRVSLASRVALFRLKLFGIFQGEAGEPMPAGLEQSFLARARWLREGKDLTSVEMVNRLGHIVALSLTLAERLQHHVVALAPPAGQEPPRPPPAGLLGLYRPPPLGRAGIVPATRSDYLELSYRLGGRNAPADFSNPDLQGWVLDLTDPVERSWNLFAVKTLQVRLWTLGYYEGVVDGQWGPLTEEAFRRLDAELPGPPTPIAIERDSEWRVLAIGPVLARILAHADEPADETSREAIDRAFASPDVSENTDLWDQLAAAQRAPRHADELSASATGGAAGYVGDDFQIAGATNLRRKRYFGWRGMFATIGRLLRRAVDVVTSFADRLLAAIRAGARMVGNVLRYLMDTTRVAVRVSALAVKRVRCWIGGTPLVTRGPAGSGMPATFCLTRWSMDFDTVHFVTRGCPAEMRAAHARELAWMERSFGLMAQIGCAIVELVLAVGNWLLFAWRALALIRALIAASQDDLIAALFAEQAAT